MSIGDFLDTEKWLMRFGMVSDAAKNDIYLYGYLIHPTLVNNVEVGIDCEKKLVKYEIWISKKLYKAHLSFLKLRYKEDLISLFRTWFLCKKYGRLNFNTILEKFISDRCGEEWKVEVIYHEGRNAETTEKKD